MATARSHGCHHEFDRLRRSVWYSTHVNFDGHSRSHFCTFQVWEVIRESAEHRTRSRDSVRSWTESRDTSQAMWTHQWSHPDTSSCPTYSRRSDTRLNRPLLLRTSPKYQSLLRSIQNHRGKVKGQSRHRWASIVERQSPVGIAHVHFCTAQALKRLSHRFSLST